MNWNIRYAVNALLDSASLGPCTGKKDCDTCLHMDEIIKELGNVAEGEVIPPRNRKSMETIKGIKKMHKDLRSKHGAVDDTDWRAEFSNLNSDW